MCTQPWNTTGVGEALLIKEQASVCFFVYLINQMNQFNQIEFVQLIFRFHLICQQQTENEIRIHDAKKHARLDCKITDTKYKSAE